MTVPEEAGKVATSTVEAFKSQPALLYLTLVNLFFLAFVYAVGTLVLQAYKHDQDNVNERYQLALKTVDRCVDAGLLQLEADKGRPH